MEDEAQMGCSKKYSTRKAIKENHYLQTKNVVKLKLYIWSVWEGKESNNVIHCFGTQSNVYKVACGFWSMCLDGSCAIASACSSYILFGGQGIMVHTKQNKWNYYCLSLNIAYSEVDCGILQRTRIRQCTTSLHIVGSRNIKLAKLNKLCIYLTIWFMWLWVIAINKFSILIFFSLLLINKLLF